MEGTEGALPALWTTPPPQALEKKFSPSGMEPIARRVPGRTTDTTGHRLSHQHQTDFVLVFGSRTFHF